MDENGKALAKPKFMREQLPALIAEFGIVSCLLRREVGVHQVAPWIGLMPWQYSRIQQRLQSPAQ